ncbi:MAG: tetratricopeptide repeat protein [Terriglobales bacterium]
MRSIIDTKQNLAYCKLNQLASAFSAGPWKNGLAAENAMKSGHLRIKVLAGALLLLGASHLANAQSVPTSAPLPDMAGSTLPLNNSVAGSIQVYVRTEDGEPLSTSPKVTIIPPSDSAAIPQMKKAGQDLWVFSGVELGDMYEVQVQAPGYHSELRPVRLLDVTGASASIIVFMRNPNDELAFHPPSGRFVLPPEAEKETQKGSTDLDSGKIDSAEKHFSKALKMAPDNPYVNYLMGMSFFLNGELPSAKPYLEKSVSADVTKLPALTALGTLRFRQADYAGAIQVLAPAARLNGSKWKVHSMLAGSYLKQKDFEHAREQAQLALTLGGKQAGGDQLVLGEALAGLGQREKAVTALEAFLAQYPNDSNDPTIRTWLPGLKNPQPVKSSSDVGSLVSTAAVDLPPKEDWAPPDIDSGKPFTIAGASCSLPKVLESAATSATQMVTDLERFSATEEYQTVEIKRTQSLEKPVSRTFSYLAFIEHPSDQVIHVNEFRNQGVANTDMPGELVDIGAPGLVLVFHPLLQGDFKWSCEGLGEWKDKPAWVVRFEQRPDRPDRLLSYQSPSGTEPLPLKGRAWVSEDGGQVMHMETDLAQPIPSIKLQREHFVIDYTTVTFAKHKVTLWLPENVDVYFQYRGHYLHHYHHFSDFKLFWTGSTQKIGKPKEAPKDKDN